MGNEASNMNHAPSGKVRRVRRVVKPIATTNAPMQQHSQPMQHPPQQFMQPMNQPMQHPHHRPTVMDPDIIQQRNMIDADSRSLIMGDRQPITADNYHDQQKQFNQRMRSEEEEFNHKQREEREKFKRRQSDARRQFDRELKKFKGEYDPYSILGVDKTIDLKRLKKIYKRLAKKHHPDRGGSSKNFELITKSYLFIEEEIQAKSSSKGHFDLKQGAEQYADSQAPVENVYIDKKNFNVKKFNQVFEKHRVSSDNDRGYGEMMSGGAREETPMIEDRRRKLFTDDFNIKVFNKVFENEVSSDDDEGETIVRGGRVIVYKEPEALVSGQLKFTELGEGRVEDFTGTTDNNKLQYTDYMQGYVKQNRLINPKKVEMRQSYKNVNDLKLQRSKIDHNLSEHDRALIERQKMLDEQYEKDRVKRLNKHDRVYEEHFNRMNQIFIKR